MSSTVNNPTPPPPFHSPTRSRSIPALTSRFPPPPPPLRQRQPQDDSNCHVYPLRRCSSDKKSDKSKGTNLAQSAIALAPRSRLDPNACSNKSRNDKSTTSNLLRRSSHRSSGLTLGERNEEGRQREKNNTIKKSPGERRSSSAALLADSQSTQRCISRAKSNSQSIEHSATNTFIRRHTAEGPIRALSRCNSTHTFSHELRLRNSNSTDNKEGVLPTLSPGRQNGPVKSLSSMTLTSAVVRSSRCNGDAQLPQRTLLSPRGRRKSFSSNSNQTGHIATSSLRRSLSKPKNTDLQSEEKSIFPRGRSKSKPRNNVLTKEETNEKSILSARRSFVNSLTRRRSLSRNASRVLSVTSTMDGNHDAEPCMQLYEALFNA
ncbi:hypothetical protein ACHAW6_004637 [Cyclotella cf. meneghiniana]